MTRFTFSRNSLDSAFVMPSADTTFLLRRIRRANRTALRACRSSLGEAEGDYVRVVQGEAYIERVIDGGSS
jgi:hypothetical protein